MSVELERVDPDDAPWAELDAASDRTVFQGREWLRFLADSQGAEPIVARVRYGGAAVGWFTGAIVRSFGLRVLGSPLPGWTTAYMGFSLDRAEQRSSALSAMPEFAFRELGCVHFELMDRRLDRSACELANSTWSVFHSFELRLRDDESMLAAMSQGARRNIRSAASNGISIEEVDPLDDRGFADEYYGQVRQSFAKRGLAPTYDVERVRSMIDHVHPSGRVLLLRARTPSGDSAATGIFPGVPHGSAVFWMGASEQGLLHLRPNEALMWHAIQAWRDRGADRFDFGGGGSFKAKFGPTAIEVPWVRCSRMAGLDRARNLAATVAKRAQRSRFQ